MNALTDIRTSVALQPQATTRRTIWWVGLCAAACWGGAAALTELWPDAGDLGRNDLLALISMVFSALLAIAVVASAFKPLPALLPRICPWLVALAIGLAGWELITAKLNMLPRPSARRSRY